MPAQGDQALLVKRLRKLFPGSNTRRESFKNGPILSVQLWSCRLSKKSWSVARYYFNCYRNTFGWKAINKPLLDYNATSAGDNMGDVLLAAQETKTGVFNVMKGDRSVGTMKCSLTWVPYPRQSQIHGV